jgi:tetratricopeptide (TPR) repeat protein
MKTQSFIYTVLIFCLLSCNNHNNSQKNKKSKDIATVIKNYKKENAIKALSPDKDIMSEEVLIFQKKQKKINPQAIKLSNKAVELFSYARTKLLAEKKILFDSTLKLLDRAIQIDSAYYLAYANKANVFIAQKKYKKAIKVLKKSVKVRENYAEGLMLQGFLYEKINMLDKANSTYIEAIEAYKARLDTTFKTKNRVNIQIDIAFMFMLIEGKQKALQFIDQIILRNPENEMALFMKENIKIFNREEFIKSL